MNLYEYWLAGSLAIPGKKKIKLKAMFPEVGELYRLKPSQVEGISFLTGLEQEKLKERQAVPEEELGRQASYCRAHNIGLVLWGDKDYPVRLRDSYNPPYGLFYRGRLPVEAQASVAVVGARNCSPYGRAAAEDIGYRLAQAGIAVISGMAAGIDGAGHQGALRAGGQTYGVLGCGIDVCYPPGHRKLYGALAAQGGVISEYPPHTKPYAMLFPQRNRLISGMADAVLVVEAKEKSGYLITADFALEQGKEVYAVPGRASDALSRGTNRLIRQGAGIFLSVGDFLEEMGVFKKEPGPSTEKQKISLEKMERVLYSCLGFHAKNLDRIMEETGFSLGELLPYLASLQEKGCILEVYKNYYARAGDPV